MKEQEEIKEFEKDIILDFELTLLWAELKSLSKYSLERPLTDEQFKKIMQLKKDLRI